MEFAFSHAWRNLQEYWIESRKPLFGPHEWGKKEDLFVDHLCEFDLAEVRNTTLERTTTLKSEIGKILCWSLN